MLLKKMFILATCLIAFLPVFSVEARDSDYGHIRGKTFYRNAGERVVSQTVDRVLDKVLGPTEKKRDEQSFRAVVQSNMNVDAPYSILSLNEILVRVVYSSGYRADTYTGNTNITKEISEGLSQFAVHCISYEDAVAEARNKAIEANVRPDEVNDYVEKYLTGKFPAELVAEVRDYNFRNVSMNMSMYDGRQNFKVMSYNGSVSVSNMSETDKDVAIRAIIRNFVSMYVDK